MSRVSRKGDVEVNNVEVNNAESNVDVEDLEVTSNNNPKKEKGKRKRMKDKYEVWDHFDKEETGGRLKAICKHCKTKYNCDPKKNGTSPLWAHISKCRKYPYSTPKESKQSLLSFQNGSNKACGGTSGLTYQKFDPVSIRKALTFMVIVDELPFKFVEGQGFKYFCSIMEPRFHVPSRQTIARGCYEMFLTEKRKLKNVLKRCNSRVSLTTDLWTSIQQINYMVLTVHFIDNDWKLQKRILSFCTVASHKGEEVGKMIEKCLLEWELEDVFCITVDNASSNDTAVAYMKRKINGWKTGVLKCRFLHMRCVAHIVNLVVGDGLKCVHDSIIRVRHAVRFIKQSPAHLLKFKKCVADEKINSKKLLCLDVPTRWNSTYLMLDAALALEDAFDRYSEEDPHYNIELYEREGNGPPTCDNWATVKRFSEFLECFYELTLRVSGSAYVTANQFFHELVNVAALLKELCASRDENMCLMACKMKEKYEKYWGNPEKINLLIFVAVVLDPRYKLDYVEWMISEIYDFNVGSILTKNLRESLYALYDEYRVFPTTDTLREDSSESRDDSHLNAPQKKVDVLKNKYKKQRGEKGGETKLELDKYLEEETEEDSDNFDVLGWWRFHCSRFPTMAKLARDVLACQVSTVASESAFSTGGRILDPFRSSLSPRVVESLVCSQNWLRASPNSLNVEECLEEVEQLEEDLCKISIAEPDTVEVLDD